MKIEDIKKPSDLNDLSLKELEQLCNEIRTFLIDNISKTGGHLSSNLGIVELTVALHNVFDSPVDKIFFDVGHQSYVHKILTGRSKEFSSLRQTNGLSGFQKRSESIHDVWEAGHSSTALSGAIGMAISRDLDNKMYDILPIVGDAAMLGGPSLEALNHLSSLDTKVIVILNDNEMSIGQRVGNVSNFLTSIRTSATYNHLKNDYKSIFSKGIIGSKILEITGNIKNNIKNSLIKNTLYDDFGLRYIGPIDGHDLKELQKAMLFAKSSKKSVLIHVKTQKGKGYSYAQNDCSGIWHGTGPFDIKSGKSINDKSSSVTSWSKVIANAVNKNMENDKNIVAITPAMINGSSMEDLFKKYEHRCFDVGIAEQHAITLVAGLSISKKKPFVSVYSSFIQRAYDQINHDITRMELPCLISIDRAGIVGSDGPTHHGVFDIGIFYPLPGVVIFAPSNDLEAEYFINYAFINFTKTYMIRIPRGNCISVKNAAKIDYIGQWIKEQIGNDPKLNIICYGNNVYNVSKLCNENNISVNIINARFIKPMDEDMLLAISKNKLPIIVYETDLKNGGLGTYISSFYLQNNIQVSLSSIAIDDKYSIQGSIDDIYKDESIDLDSLLLKIKEITNG